MPEKKQKEPIWGIRIIPKVEKENGEIKSISYSTEIGVYRRGDLFATNAAVAKAIKENKHVKTDEIGSEEKIMMGKIKIIPETINGEKVFVTDSFHPFGASMFTEIFRPVFEKKGIASFIEMLIEKDLAKREPGCKIASTIWPSPNRIGQLRKKGRHPGIPEPIEKALAKSIMRVREGLRQHGNKTGKKEEKSKKLWPTIKDMDSAINPLKKRKMKAERELMLRQIQDALKIVLQRKKAKPKGFIPRKPKPKRTGKGARHLR